MHKRGIQIALYLLYILGLPLFYRIQKVVISSNALDALFTCLIYFLFGVILILWCDASFPSTNDKHQNIVTFSVGVIPVLVVMAFSLFLPLTNIGPEGLIGFYYPVLSNPYYNPIGFLILGVALSSVLFRKTSKQ